MQKKDNLKRLIIKLILAWGLGLCLTLAVVVPLGNLRAVSSVVVAAEHTVCSDGLPTCTYTNIQAAVDAASNGDIIKVATGFYTDVQAYTDDSATPRQIIFINKNVTIRGGYTTTNWITPESDVNPTILDAQRQGRVIYIRGGHGLTIENLHITGGDAAAGGSVGWTNISLGGGILASFTDAIISNTVFTNNQADRGGGMAVFNSEVVISDTVFTANTANSVGGGLNAISSTSVSVYASNIYSNTAKHGGGLAGITSLRDSTVVSNVALVNGGGLNLSGCFPKTKTFANNIVANNQVDGSGSAFYINATWCGAYHMLHNTVTHNQGGDGSGIYVTGNGMVVFTNTILVSHTVGITVSSGNTVTLENTLWGSHNWANKTDFIGPGTVNTNNDYRGFPDFVDPDGGGYHIDSTSLAIDNGVTTTMLTDIDGDLRDITPDLGADEWVGNKTHIKTLLPIILKE